MGNLFGRSRNKKDYHLLMTGLTSSGKTTILYQLQIGKITNTIPMSGLHVETAKYKNTIFNAFDTNGKDNLRPHMNSYYSGNSGIIFVIDSTNPEQLDGFDEWQGNAKIELDKLLMDEDLQNVPLLIFANKQDKKGSMTVHEITKRLELNKIKRQWFVQGTNALNGSGLYSGLNWLTTKILENK